jgi:hypothetical protein
MILMKLIKWHQQLTYIGLCKKEISMKSLNILIFCIYMMLSFTLMYDFKILLLAAILQSILIFHTYPNWRFNVITQMFLFLIMTKFDHYIYQICLWLNVFFYRLTLDLSLLGLKNFVLLILIPNALKKFLSI